MVAGRLGPPRVVAGGRRRCAPFAADDLAVYAVAAAVLGAVRKAKSEAKRSMRTEVTRGGRARHRPSGSRALEPALDDVRDAGRVVGDARARSTADELAVDVELAEPE